MTNWNGRGDEGEYKFKIGQRVKVNNASSKRNGQIGSVLHHCNYKVCGPTGEVVYFGKARQCGNRPEYDAGEFSHEELEGVK